MFHLQLIIYLNNLFLDTSSIEHVNFSIELMQLLPSICSEIQW